MNLLVETCCQIPLVLSSIKSRLVLFKSRDSCPLLLKKKSFQIQYELTNKVVLKALQWLTKQEVLIWCLYPLRGASTKLIKIGLIRKGLYAKSAVSTDYWFAFSVLLFFTDSNLRLYSNLHHYLQLLQMVAIICLPKFPKLPLLHLFLHTGKENANSMLRICLLLLPHYH